MEDHNQSEFGAPVKTTKQLKKEAEKAAKLEKFKAKQEKQQQEKTKLDKLGTKKKEKTMLVQRQKSILTDYWQWELWLKTPRYPAKNKKRNIPLEK